MKMQKQIMQKLALLALFPALNARLSTAHAGDRALLNQANQAHTILSGRIGANAGMNYQADGSKAASASDSTRLHCISQGLDGAATSSGLWLTSTTTEQFSDSFQVKAISLGRKGILSLLAEKG